MNVLIIGCRKSGSNLAKTLDETGHDVSILAETSQDLQRMENFSNYVFGGMGFVGVPVDIEVLIKSGIRNVDAVVCVTADDNINLMVAQMAREMFHIERVLCRVAEPLTKEVFTKNFGLRVICPTNITVETTLDLLLEDVEPPAVALGGSTLGFIYTKLPAGLAGKTPADVPLVPGRLLIGILHADHVSELVNQLNTPLLEDDRLIWTEILDG